MNVRTNLRTWRDEAIYIIVVRTIGAKTKKPYIYARLEAISTTHYHTKILCEGIEQFLIEEDRLYLIPHNRTYGITSPQRAVEEAVRRYKTGE